METKTEQELIQFAKTGNAEAFGELVHQHQRSVFNVCYRMLHNAQDAEDLTQDAFLRAYNRLDTFNLKYDFGPWIRKIAVNLCLNSLQRKSFETQSLDMKPIKSARPGPEHIVEANQEAEHLKFALQTLKPTYRAVIELRHYQQLSYKDIANTLNLPMSDVKSYLFRARKTLAGLLQDEN